jgi:protein-tyrosine phosphatase
MYKIDDGLYQGALPKKGLPEGVTAVVTLLSHAENHDQPLHKQVEVMISLPIEDGPWPGIDWLKNAIEILEVLRKKHKIYIHCRGGVSRSAMLTAALLMKENRWDVDHALNFIAEKNSDIDPAPRFILGLKEWQKSLGI